MLSITKRFTFCYGHRLPGYPGKCSNQHGHNSILEIEVTGLVSPDGPYKGMIFDFGDLKGFVEKQVIEILDHHYLNDVFPESFQPTAENLVLWIRGRLVEGLFSLARLELIRVRLYETDTAWAEWRR